MEERLTALGYDAAQHRKVRARAGQLEEYRDLAQRLQEASERLPQEEAAASEMEELLAARRRDAQQARERMDAIGVALERLPALEEEAARRGGRAPAAGVRGQPASAGRRREHAAAGGRGPGPAAPEGAGGPDGRGRPGAQRLRGPRRRLREERRFPPRLIEAALPDLESGANEILARLTDGRLSLFLETQRTTARGDVRETLEIRIHDGVGTRSYELFSGGEAFRINFALRIALAKLLATRAGAPLRTLFLDEGFGTQGRPGAAAPAGRLSAPSSGISISSLVITHIDELKEAFPVRIEVTRTQEAGSTFQVVWS